MFIYGASGYGKVVLELAEVSGKSVDFFVDDNVDLVRVRDILVFANIPENALQGILAIGSNKIRKRLSETLSFKEFVTLIHPKATISKSVRIGAGTVVIAGATINADVKVGRHVIVNTNASIDHDCSLEDFVHVSPNVALAGGVRVGEGTHIGVGACVIPGIRIGKWATIGAGTVIINDVPDGATVVGNPGREIK
jgi:sugar O-acyltransferase (sialic acid O-acetyltransferase NeuD family)